MEAPIADAAGRALRDREHYDRIAGDLARKDLYPPSAVARRHRHLQSVALADVGALGDVLEIGCGCGFGARYLADACSRYTGVDHSPGVIGVANGEDHGAHARFLVADGADLGRLLPGDRFDALFMIGVLHHVPDPVGVLRGAMRALKPGAVVIANEPQSGNPLVSGLRRLRKLGDGDYSEEQDEYAADAFRAILEGAGLERVALHGQGMVSTPFAEVMVPPRAVAGPLARLAVRVDAALERAAPGLMRRFGWNLVGVGRVPAAGRAEGAT